MKTRTSIIEGTIKNCLEIMSQIPEFNDNQYDEAAYLKRLSDTKDLMLVAVVNHVQVGFKVGYDRDKDGSFTVGWAALLLIIENKRLRKI